MARLLTCWGSEVLPGPCCAYLQDVYLSSVVALVHITHVVERPVLSQSSCAVATHYLLLGSEWRVVWTSSDAGLRGSGKFVLKSKTRPLCINLNTPYPLTSTPVRESAAGYQVSCTCALWVEYICLARQHTTPVPKGHDQNHAYVYDCTSAIHD